MTSLEFSSIRVGDLIEYRHPPGVTLILSLGPQEHKFALVVKALGRDPKNRASLTGRPQSLETNDVCTFIEILWLDDSKANHQRIFLNWMMTDTDDAHMWILHKAERHSDV